jgi:hypothetical protein
VPKQSEKDSSLGNRLFSAAKRLFNRDENKAAEPSKTPAAISAPKPAASSKPSVLRTSDRRVLTRPRGVQFSTDILVDKRADKTVPPSTPAQTSTSNMPTPKKRRNADEIMLADDWLSRQKPTVSPPTVDIPVETRSAKKKRKIRRVPYAPTETTPTRVRRPASQLPLLQGRKPVNIQQNILARSTSAPKKNTERRNEHIPRDKDDHRR